MRSTASSRRGDIVPAKRGFSIAESELGLSANVDDKFYGNLIFSLAPDNSVEVEEAYGLFTAVPYGFAPKFGRFLSAIGYLNDQHQHVWDFYDAPLPYQAFLGGQFHSDGLQLKWVAPTEIVPRVRRRDRRRLELPRHRPQQERHRRWRRLRPRRRRHRREQQLARRAFLPATAAERSAVRASRHRGQSMRRSAFPARASSRSPTSSGNGRRTAMRWTRISSFRANISGARRRAISPTTAMARSASPARRTTRRARAAGTSTASISSCRTGALARATTGSSTGTVDYGANGIYLAQDSFNPQRYSVMVDYTPSEFSRFRVQWQQSKIRPDLTDNQLFVQYILTLGAHGAHKF